MTISFAVRRDEALIIDRIASRAIGLGIYRDRLECHMDVTACHANGNPLRLEALADAPRDFDFVHDLAGIRRHLDRDTGQLRDCFSPRYSAPIGRGRRSPAD
jgi:hypothetical protein